MQRPEYNQTVRETLRQLDITLDDCINIYTNKDDFNSILSYACYEKFDNSYQPVIQAVNLLELLYNNIKKCNPDVVLLYQLLKLWQEVLLEGKEHLSQQFSKSLYNNGIKLSNAIQTQIQQFCTHVQKNNALISVCLDFAPPQTDLDIQPIYVPAHTYPELSTAKQVNPEDEKEAQPKPDEKTEKVDFEQRIKEELELMTYEDKFGKRMQVDITKKNQRLRYLKSLQEAECAQMKIEEEFSQNLTLVYRKELKQREEEAKVRQLVTETANPSLNACYSAVFANLRGDQKKK